MQKDETPISVREMIERYNRELMEFQKKHAAARPAANISTDDNQLDRDFPVPDMTRDLQALRQTQENTQTESAMERVLEAEPGEMATSPGMDRSQRSEVSEPPKKPREMEPGEMDPSPGVEQPRNTYFINPSAPQADHPDIISGMATPAQPSQGTPAFPVSPTAQEIAPTATGQDMSLGYLRVAVTTGRGTIPIQNAQVIVTRVVDGNELLEQADRTNSSGITPLFTLPAVSSIYSQSPGNGTPYTYYTIYVRADGFYPIQLCDVPLYGGITSIQPVELTPVAEGGDPNQETTITEGAPENLN